MTRKEKIQLAILLNKYMCDLLAREEAIAKDKQTEFREWSGDKAMFHHVRIIERKISKEIEEHMYDR